MPIFSISERPIFLPRIVTRANPDRGNAEQGEFAIELLMVT